MVITVLGAESTSGSGREVSVCEIESQPSKFVGRDVEIRAQIWPDVYQPGLYWLNEASIKFGTVCHFLGARFTFPTDLSRQSSFGTFTGSIVIEHVNTESKTFAIKQGQPDAIFVIKEQSNIRLSRMYLQGPVQQVQLFDQQTASFVSPR